MTDEPKSIQKYPELAGCKTSKEYIDRVYALHPDLPKGASNQAIEQRNEKLIAILLENPFYTEAQRQDVRNQTWEVNHIRLTSAIQWHINEKGRMPSTNDLVKETGLSRLTIRKHLAEFNYSPFYQEQLQQFRMLSTQVVVQLFNLAMQGDVKAARLYLDAVGGLPGIQPPASPSPPTNNYIQINNNVKIDQNTFGLLPEMVQQQITRLVLEGLQTTVVTPVQIDSQQQHP